MVPSLLLHPQLILPFHSLLPLRIRSYLRHQYNNAKNGPVILDANFGCGLRLLLKVKVNGKVVIN